ncbi:MAG: T9SS type A sorting domain-containing protein [Bacteroidales bacterium]|nr:T9SS type A sorting domain-containing protein [Bacteroidales bacterium]
MKKILLFLGMFTQVILVYSAPDWSVNSSDFEYSLTITGIIEHDGIVCSEGDLLAGFVNGECRGVVQSIYEESMDKYYFYLTVFSNTFSGEQVSFKYYNASQNITFEDFDLLEFEEGLNVGGVSQPYMITKIVSNIYNINTKEKVLSIYPNPVKDFVHIEIVQDIESVSIYNSLGQNMYVNNANEKNIDLSELKTGIYFISVCSGSDIYQARILKN